MRPVFYRALAPYQGERIVVFGRRQCFGGKATGEALEVLGVGFSLCRVSATRHAIHSNFALQSFAADVQGNLTSPPNFAWHSVGREWCFCLGSQQFRTCHVIIVHMCVLSIARVVFKVYFSVWVCCFCWIVWVCRFFVGFVPRWVFDHNEQLRRGKPLYPNVGIPGRAAVYLYPIIYTPPYNSHFL